jgi:putative restriction endonuclease
MQYSLFQSHPLHTLTALRRGGSKYGISPHKPVLLLSLIDLIETLSLQENRFPIGPPLFERFRYNWKLLVDTGHKPDISQPLHYLKNDGLWKLIQKDGELRQRQIRSQRQLQLQISHGQLSDPLFGVLQSSHNRQLARMILLDTYFPETKERYLNQYALPSLFSEIEQEVWKERPPRYRKKQEWKETEGFVRDWKFREGINRIYGGACAVSSWKVETPFTMIDACHIEDHALSGINHLSNGIALCPNLHRAFDNGLLLITDDYRVRISSGLEENDSPYQLQQFHEKKILLPENRAYWPDPDRLKWRRERWR